MPPRPDPGASPAVAEPRDRPDPPGLAIVVVHYRSWGQLDDCLLSLLDPGTAPLRAEIVVVDNDSDDGQLESFARRFPRVRFVANSGNHGFAHGCNLGARVAAADNLLFLNPDVVARPDQIVALLAEQHRHPEIALLAPLQADARGRPQKVGDLFPSAVTNLPLGKRLLRAARAAGGLARDPAGTVVESDWVTGSALLVRRADLERLGGWDDHYWMYAEDVDLCHRARAAGMKVAVTSKVTLSHRHGGASRRDEATTVRTKTEVIVSKHLFYCRRYTGSRAWLAHLSEVVKRTLPLALAAALDLATLGRVAGLRIRTAVLLGLLGHYRRWRVTGSPVSPRSVRSQIDR